ncbi:MAG TPA: radical SAM protein [Anaerolineae bacterium]|nr:radical SAM protein [Anaerolineae bacterium]
MSLPKLLLISPPAYERLEWREAQPLGIAYLAAYLRAHGYALVDLLDASTPRVLSVDEIAAQAVGYDLVGFSVLSQTMPAATAAARRIKEVCPGTLIVFGGHHPTFTHWELLRDFPCVDAAVRGEGELTLLEMIEVLTRATSVPDMWVGILGVTYRTGDGRIVVNPPRPLVEDLDSVPFPARDLLPPLEAYPSFFDVINGKVRTKASIISSRGCPYHCSFCSIVAFYESSPGKPWRDRSVQNVVDEMESLVRKHGVSHFEFQDDNFFVQPQRVLQIAQGLRKRGVDFTFAFLTRSDQICRGEMYFRPLQEAGLRYVGIGLESGSEDSLDRLDKGTTPAQNARALDILRQHGIGFQVDFIMFEPYTTIADLQANLDFMMEHGLYGYFPPLVLTQLELYPGTRARAEWEAGHGSTDVHSSLRYTFKDSDVAAIKAALDEFQARCGARWYGLGFQLLEDIPRLAVQLRQQRGGEGVQLEQQRLLGELQLEFEMLSRIPYTLLRRLLQDGQERGFDHLQPEPYLDGIEAQLTQTVGRVELLRASLLERKPRVGSYLTPDT